MNLPYQPQTIQPALSDYERLADIIDQRATKRSGKSLLEFAPTVPITAGPRKGALLKLEDAPYSRRVFELMDPSHICQLLVNMWASQSMKSVCAQVTVGYYTIEVPSEIIYAMSTQSQTKKVMNRRLTPMLEKLGVEFITSTESKGTRNKGNTTFSKEFNGGNLDGVTQGSSADLAAETKRLGVADELGDWKVEVSNQGNPYYQILARLKAWLDEKKFIVPSTPGDETTCMVWSLFQTGTMEEWSVHCPLCGALQILEVQNRDGYGLQWDTKRGRVLEPTIVYVCCSCAKSFTEKRKFEIQQDGIWIPKKDHEPIDKYTYSLHLHSINSMFESWREIASVYERGRDDPIAQKYYDNHVAGIPHRQTGAKINTSEVIKNNRGDYNQGTVPDGVCYLVFGGDVQRGSDRWQNHSEAELQVEIDKALEDDKKTDENSAWDMKFPRIEFEIMGVGMSYRSWSIDYQVIYGKIDTAFSGAFEKLFEWGEWLIQKNGGFGYKREKDGLFFGVKQLFIDSGHATTTVYDFTQRWKFTNPAKSDREVTVAKKDAHLHNSNFLPWKKSKVSNGLIDLYTISNKLYIAQLHQRLKTKRVDDDVQWATFQDFPKQYPTRYFDMLTADELTEDKGYTARGKPNEASACRQLCFAAADVYLSQRVEYYRQREREKKRYSDLKIEDTIRSRFVIEIMARDAKVGAGYFVTKSKG